MNKVSISACVIWLVGFVLSFVVKPGSPDVGWPDFLLLAGFLPLLVSYKPIWPWFVFGVGNVIIGFVLAMAHFISGEIFPSSVLPVKDHLDQMHVPIIWILFGFFAIACGVLRLLKKLIVYLVNAMKKN